MYRIDHLAFRTLDRKKSVEFFCQALGYQEQETFDIFFDKEKTEKALCTALEPSNRVHAELPWTMMVPFGNIKQEYGLAPEIFVSEGTPGSIVNQWATARGQGGLHHIALQVPDSSSVEAEMEIWKEKGWAQGFSTDEVIKCPGLSQVFTKPNLLLGVVFELIQRVQHGFCKDSVLELMKSTVGD